jgi:glutaconyl-CoA/methylmalonyl-CoA decarboxylase subunit gamma
MGLQTGEVGVLRRYSVSAGGKTWLVEVEERQDDRVRVVVEGRERELQVQSLGGGRYAWIEETRVVKVDVEGVGGPASGRAVVSVDGQAVQVEVADGRAAAIAPTGPTASVRAAGPTAVRSPIPGRVVKVLARPGEEVKAGRGVVVVEAMKMENEIRAPRDGRVQEVKVAEGAAVESGQDLVVLE